MGWSYSLISADYLVVLLCGKILNGWINVLESRPCIHQHSYLHRYCYFFESFISEYSVGIFLSCLRLWVFVWLLGFVACIIFFLWMRLCACGREWTFSVFSICCFIQILYGSTVIRISVDKFDQIVLEIYLHFLR